MTFPLTRLTTAQVTAIVTASAGVAVAAGIHISKDLQNHIIVLITVLAPVLVAADAHIRHGTITASAATAVAATGLPASPPVPAPVAGGSTVPPVGESTVVGRVAGEVVVRDGGGGRQVATFPLELDPARGGGGSVRVVAWDGAALDAGRELHLGSDAVISGVLQARSSDGGRDLVASWVRALA